MCYSGLQSVSRIQLQQEKRSLMDRNYKISLKKLQDCLHLLYGEISTTEVEEIIKSVELGEDGLLGLDDIVGVEGEEEEEEMMSELREAFGMYAINEDQGITPRSLKRMLSQLGESKTIGECSVMVNQFDLNGDGVVTFDEFRVMMQ